MMWRSRFGVLRGAGKQVVQAGARPELAVEFVVQLLGALERDDLAENRGPAGNGHHHQQGHHGLDNPAGVEQERDNRKVLVHGAVEVSDKIFKRSIGELVKQQCRNARRPKCAGVDPADFDGGFA